MKIGIYNSSVDNFDLGCVSAGILADALASKHQTEILVQQDSASRQHLEAACTKDLGRVAFRAVSTSPVANREPARLDRRYEALRDWSDELTRPYDLFINFADRIPLHNSAQRGVLVVQFPHDFIPSPYRMFWHEHLASYQLTIANSYFTSFWTRLLWDTECPVVYPPVPIQVATTVSDKMVLAAASFNERHDHLKLFESFAKLQQQAPGWKMTLMARLNRGQASRRQFEKVITAAPASGVSIVANPTREEEDELFRRARLFWQASGSCTEFDLIAEPLNALVLRAMASGCIPLVNNTGALSEVVHQAENGFFWDTTEELIEFSARLVHNESQRLKLSQAARRRVLDFRPETFADAFQKQLESAFGIRYHSVANPVQLWKRLLRSTSQRLTSRR